MNRPLLNILIPAFLAGLVLLVSCSDDDPAAPQLPKPLTILGQDVSEVSAFGATLSGWVDGHSSSTVCWFEIGIDNTYGLRSPEISASTVDGPARVEYQLVGLDHSKVHLWRLVAVAGTDTAFAADTTFTTLPRPNLPPDTRAMFSPLHNNPVPILWTGYDNDGTVTGFRWRMSNNGLTGIEEPDTLGLPWNFTTATDSIYTVSADLPAPREPGDTGPRLFFRIHTFWIKAVDNLGAEDPSPAYFSFTTTTEAPEVIVAVSPSVDSQPDSCLELPLPLAFTWIASDSDSPEGALLEVRTLLVNLSDLGLDACLTQEEYEMLDPLASIDETLWSDWQEYDPESVEQPTFELGPEHVGGRYLFAAMARDFTGAWTVDLVWGVNVWQVEVSAD